MTRRAEVEQFDLPPKKPSLRGGSTPDRKLVDLTEAADQLCLSMSGIRSWIIRRQIDYVKVGNRVKIKQSTIDDIIERGTVRAIR